MKILLIQPPIRDFYETSIRSQPLGLAYVAASLKSNGYEVEILDCRQGKKISIPLPHELSYLRDVYPFDDRSPFKLYSGFYHFGSGWEEIRQKVEASNADVFGISSSFTPYHPEALEIARIIKKGDERRIVVMGGGHISCAPESALESPWVDYLVLGEGEIRFPRLLEKIEKQTLEGVDRIDGIGYRKDGAIRINPIQHWITSLDDLPLPARELLLAGRYRIKDVPSTMILTSRGCPHRCAYCSAHLLMGSTFRARSPEPIVAEMQECHEKYGTRAFDIEDDNFTFDRERAVRLMNLIIETFGERTLELTAMNGISFVSLDRELLKLMKRAGFDTINLSFVSAEPATTRRMGRPAPGRSFEEVARDAESAGLRAVAYAILGMPGQTVEEMGATLVELMGRRVLIGPSIYYPTPGTPLYHQCKAGGLLPPWPSQWRSTAFPIETEEFSRLDIVTLFRLARTINFIKGKIDAKTLEEGVTWEGIHRITAEPRKSGTERATSAVLPRSADRSLAWEALLFQVIHERSFFGLRKQSCGRVVPFKVRSSRKVLDRFLREAWDKPILGSR